MIVSSDARIEKHVTIKSILCDQGKSGIVSSLENIHSICRLEYLADVFQQLNKVNLKLQVQRRGRKIFDFTDTLNAFVEKLDNWKRKDQAGNFALCEMVLRRLVMK